MFSGGALSRFTIFALGIMPYISASIIMQLMHGGVADAGGAEEGRRVGPPQDHAVHALRDAGAGDSSRRSASRSRWKAQRGLVIDPGLLFRFTTVVTLVTGTMFLMWLGEQITERGIGNGISLIIFAGIAAGLPRRDRRHARAGAHRRVLDSAGAAAVRRRWCRGDRVRRVRRARRSARSWCNYAKRQVGQQGLRRAELAPAAEAQHVGRDSADLRVDRSSCSRPRWRGWFGTGESTDLAARHRAARCIPGSRCT